MQSVVLYAYPVVSPLASTIAVHVHASQVEPRLSAMPVRGGGDGGGGKGLGGGGGGGGDGGALGGK